MSNLDDLPILTEIKDGQPYVDKPVYKTLLPKKLRVAIQQVMDVYATKSIFILASYNHVKLRWMKPGPDGELVPR